MCIKVAIISLRKWLLSRTKNIAKEDLPKLATISMIRKPTR